MNKLIDIIITWLWENFLKAIFAKLDRWDVLFLSMVSVCSVILWYYTTRFNVAEKLLWFVLLIILAIVWLIIRKIPWRNSWTIKQLKLPWVVIKIGLVLLLAAGWAYARYWFYRIPKFPTGVSGFYVSRFENDPNDDYQARLVDSLERAIREQGLTHEIQLAKLPRVVAEQEAQRLGEVGGAALVLWGKIVGGQPRCYLTIINASGVYNSVSINDGESALNSELPKMELPTDVENFPNVMAQFLAGYGFYHKGNYGTARDFFKTAEAQLTPEAEKEKGLTTARITLGSINFYEGTTNYYLGASDTALANYQKAVAFTSRPADNQPLYVEPLNNLAFLEMKTGKSKEAFDHLSQATSTCQREWQEACAAVDYNLGLLLIERKDYDKAIEVLGRVVNRLQPQYEKSATTNLRLLGLAHKNIAYAYVMLADNAPAQAGEQLYNTAQRELDESTKILSKVSQAPLATTIMVQSRIHLGLKHYDQALEALKGLGNSTDPTLNLLYAVAYACKGERNNAITYVMKLQTSDEKTRAENTEYFDKLKSRCQ